MIRMNLRIEVRPAWRREPVAQRALLLSPTGSHGLKTGGTELVTAFLRNLKVPWPLLIAQTTKTMRNWSATRQILVLCATTRSNTDTPARCPARVTPSHSAGYCVGRQTVQYIPTSLQTFHVVPRLLSPHTPPQHLVVR